MNLSELQTAVRVSKNMTNEFGGFKYRNAETILAVAKHEMNGSGNIICSDDVVEIGGRFFMKSTATVTLGESIHSANGMALHVLEQKGKDPAMISGSCSSYARKYALQGLLAIDDGSFDPDATHGRDKAKNNAQRPDNNKGSTDNMDRQQPKSDLARIRDEMKSAIQNRETIDSINVLFGRQKFKDDYHSLPEPMQNEIRHARKVQSSSVTNQQSELDRRGTGDDSNFDNAPAHAIGQIRQDQQREPDAADTRDQMKFAISVQKSIDDLNLLFAAPRFISDYKSLPEFMQSEIRRSRQGMAADLEQALERVSQQ